MNENDLKKVKGLPYDLKPFTQKTNKNKDTRIVRNKLVDLKTAIKNSGLKDGMTISFHHHFRGGDLTVRAVMDVIKELKIKDLTIASSSFTDAHNFLTKFIEEGYVSGLETSGCRDELGRFVSSGKCPKPMVIRSHGGRARAIASGDLKIDVAFIAASSSDVMGNSNGVIGKSPCGSLGYAMIDAQYANKTIILTDTIVDFPNQVKSISQIDVDYVVKIDSIGDPKKIVGGEIRLSSAPKEEIIANYIANVVTNTSLFKPGFSIQMGSGGASLSAVKSIKVKMKEQNIVASFALGGITSHQVSLLEEGLVEKLIDVQCFDFGAVQSIAKNPNHIEVSASEYANPHNKSPFVNKLDYVILSALEVDLDFNVNVITGSDGVIRGASGGHSDTSDGAKISIVALPLIRGRINCISKKVNTIVTPGDTVDVVITDFGIAVNPARQDIIKELEAKNIRLSSLQEMHDMAEKVIGVPKEIEYDLNHPVAVVEYRDGSIIDVVYKIKD